LKTNRKPNTVVDQSRTRHAAGLLNRLLTHDRYLIQRFRRTNGNYLGQLGLRAGKIFKLSNGAQVFKIRRQNLLTILNFHIEKHLLSSSILAANYKLIRVQQHCFVCFLTRCDERLEARDILPITK